MGRKLFLSHLANTDRLISAGIHDVQTPDEGIITFTYLYPTSPFHRVTIQACATDLGEYPDGNSFMLCTEDDAPHPTVPTTLQRLTESAHGKSLTDLLSEVAENLTTAISTGSSPDDTTDDTFDEDAQDEDDFGFEFENDSDHDFFGPTTRKPSVTTGADDFILDSSGCEDTDGEKISKIRADLNALKTSGFRLGVFGNLATSGVLCASIRISKLGLSDEAMEAWSMPRKRYLVLLVRYSRGYRDATKVADDKELSSSVQMRVGLCEHYKPSLRHVLSVFQYANPDDAASKAESAGVAEDDYAFEPLFIGKALNQFLEERLFKIIYARDLYRLTWLGAEKFISERQASASTEDVLDMKPYHCDDAINAKNLLPIVVADHLRQVPLSEASLPLLIMQFVLRHVVRCTEFCMVCHCRVDDSFEALKPYVCLKPLCLFQYLALGFGPSLEWEVLTQPFVVDLLVSFCYAAASGGRLKELPVGMSLTVPLLVRSPNVALVGTTQYQRAQFAQYAPVSTGAQEAAEESFMCTWDGTSQHLTVVENEEPETSSAKNSTPQVKKATAEKAARHKAAVNKLKAGDWFVFEAGAVESHCRVSEVRLPQIGFHEPISVSPVDAYTTGGGRVEDRKSPIIVNCYLYDKHFDDLSKVEQHRAVMVLLSTLPGVIDMRNHLEHQGKNQESSLKTWTNRISDSALNLLRWVVASNRSCILQVDEIRGDDGVTFPGRSEDRVGSMDKWIQFRFAQGAPDKEKRFNDCVKEQVLVSGTKYPTIFAWHGSNIGNWHSIIRQGLRYDEVVNGRAYGNGIYMSNTAHTSLGYSHGAGLGVAAWKPSALKITTALSLQEVVNKPQDFVSSQPHYVVANIDWVQTRYLLVKAGEAPVLPEGVPTFYEQDPSRLVHNESNTAVSIPITAISKTRRPAKTVSANSSPQGKRTKIVSTTDQATAEKREDDADSVISDAEDVALLQEPVEKYNLALRGSQGNADSGIVNDKKRSADVTEESDFVPGDLDMQGIKFMEESQDATPIATKALMRLLKDALNTQENTALANLGWYIDRNLVNNMYQWIVELHSFPKDLPLAQDMKAAGLKSIVMEMRFTSQYPFSPPFIRVVKPKFLPFQQGGGGNVTDGGAMCMEVLTNNGWSAGLTIESLLLQVRLVMMDTERPARLAPQSRYGGQSTYGIGEAIAAYIRACQSHGWKVPAGFNTIQQ
ncbi:hypothetical protein H2200_005420 [Cladophialophora chaetospira]|uniref:UBC core domain-containing protein n=1 Tax=Cladophialophora chaetospira TaxID=386627 RepID=A0AA38XBY6_9EURO|nr:hypothetical protein H2200_005420 [Cladophialophora chaetospira]